MIHIEYSSVLCDESGSFENAILDSQRTFVKKDTHSFGFIIYMFLSVASASVKNQIQTGLNKSQIERTLVN